MDKLSASNFAMDSSAVPNPSEGMSSPPPTVPDQTAGATDSAVEDSVSRQHPIPPASEPMQYRAIGLVYGKYTPSEEQFTKGELHTEDGTVIDSVLLGRVMSLVKKHIDLEKSHLWVVYPRTREKQYDLHLQIMGIWEPENLSHSDGDETMDAEAESDIVELPQDETTEPVAADSTTETTPVEAPEEEKGAELTEATSAAIAETPVSEPAEAAETETVEPEEAEATEAEAAEAETAEPADAPPSDADSETSSVTETTAATSEEPTDVGETVTAAAAIAEASTTVSEDAAEKAGGAIAESTDGYFSIRGEILFYAEEGDNLVVRIQQSPKKEGKPPKAFKLILDGTLEGKTVGYFWELHVQREGNRLVVQDGKMIAMVPPKKNKKRRGGPGSGPPKPRRQSSGPPRKPWKKSHEGRDPQSSSSEVQKPVKRPKRVMKPLGGE